MSSSTHQRAHWLPTQPGAWYGLVGSRHWQRLPRREPIWGVTYIHAFAPPRCKRRLSVDVTEKATESTGTMWNTNLLFDADGTLLNRHRKLVPTWAEKLTWANGDASNLRVEQTELGKLGILICGENTNTLARFALLAQGEQVHIASYPPAWRSEERR